MTANPALKDDQLVLEINRHFDVPREVLFKAWTDPSWILRWMGPGECTCPFAETDLKIGGAYKICIRGEGDHWAHGLYQVIDAPRRLVFTWRWEQEDGSLGQEMLVEINFVESGDGTDLRFRQTKFIDQEACDQHRQGWEGSLACLEKILSA